MYLHGKTPALVGTLLRTDTSVLGDLIQHVEFLKNLELKLAAFLGPLLNQHCTIANYANNTLLLYTDSPSWASRIRYSTPQILQFLQKECHLASLKTIRIKVKPASAQTTPPSDKRLKLDGHTAGLIRQSASSMTDDTLKRLLLKISKNTQNRS